DEMNQNLYNMFEVPEAGTSFLSELSVDDTYFQRIEQDLKEALQPDERQNTIILEEITTIPELAKAIDNYLDNPRTDRRILINQIKRATQQIQRDLRQTDLDNVLNDLNLRTIAYNNKRTTCKEDLHKFLIQFRAEIEGREIDIADAAGDPPTRKDHAKGLLRGCMRGTILEWFDKNITTKQNFELYNLLDNIAQSTIQLVARYTAVQLDTQALYEANGCAVECDYQKFEKHGFICQDAVDFYLPLFNKSRV
ncbi:7964_t:CDS:2, partial [Diversispora eburnea]